MGNRLTSKWTKTTEEAFGNSPAVRKGRLGELFVMEALQQWGWNTIDYESDKNKQVQQIDIEFKSPDWAKWYSASIKANMDDDGNIYVYENWIYKTAADRIFHCNPKTRWMAWYDTTQMQRFFTQHLDQTLNRGNGNFLKIKPGDCRHFIRRKIIEVRPY